MRADMYNDIVGWLSYIVKYSVYSGHHFLMCLCVCNIYMNVYILNISEEHKILKQ